MKLNVFLKLFLVLFLLLTSAGCSKNRTLKPIEQSAPVSTSGRVGSTPVTPVVEARAAISLQVENPQSFVTVANPEPAEVRTTCVRISNSGSSEVALVGSTVSAPFELSPDGAVCSSPCALNSPLAVGATCSYKMAFKPLQAGDGQTAVFRVNYSAPLSPSLNFPAQEVVVTGRAEMPSPLLDIQWDVNPAFNVLPRPTPVPAACLKLRNNAALSSGRNIKYLGAVVPLPFALSTANDCSSPCATNGFINAGQECRLKVLFNPDVSGSFSGNIVVQLKDSRSKESIPSRSFAVSGIARPLPSPLALSLVSPFPTVTPSPVPAPSRCAIVRNPDTLGAVFLSASLGAGSFRFSSPNDCPNQCVQNAAIAAGGTCHLKVEFNPLVVGTSTASLSVSFRNSASLVVRTAALSLSGVSVQPPTPSPTPRPSLSSGYYFSCAIRDGALYCWGYNGYGNLGIGNTLQKLVPTPVIGMDEGVTSVATGHYHTCAVKNGAVWCWGYNGYGQLGDGTNAQRLVPVAVSSLSSGVKEIAAGAYNTCALLNNGSLKCWGYNGQGQLGSGSTALYSNLPTSVSGLSSGVAQVSIAGEYNVYSHLCALHNGEVKCWGYNGYSQLGDSLNVHRTTPYRIPSLATGVTFVGAYANRTCVVQSGAAKCWGYNADGELGNGNNLNQKVPTLVSGLSTGVTALGGGVWHQCAIKAGAMYCWGYNASGQLGDGRYIGSNVPVAVSGMDQGVTEIGKEALQSTCAVKAGELFCWGQNSNGQLGEGSTTNYYGPTRPGPFE